MAALHFVVPVRSPEVSKDWGHVAKLARQTVASICRQTIPDFRLHLVCHTAPSDLPHCPQLEVIEVDLPIPQDKDEMLIDKNAKIQHGLVEVRGEGGSYVMIVDADDRVHRGLTEWVSNHLGENGWYVSDGYVYPYGRSYLFKWTDFHLYCGTSSIVRCLPGDLPRHPDEPFSSSILLRNGHHKLVQKLDERGTPLSPLPFQGACWVTDTSENHSGISLTGWRSTRDVLTRIFRARPLTSWHRSRFGI